MKNFLLTLAAMPLLLAACIQTSLRPAAPTPATSAPVASAASARPLSWLVLAPIPCRVATAEFHRDFLASCGGEKAAVVTPATVLKLANASKGGVELRPLALAPSGHEVELKKRFPFDDSLAYAYAEYRAPATGLYYFRFGSDDDAIVFVNGKAVHEYRGSRGVRADDDRFKVLLNRGANRILVKIGNRSGDWGFALNILPEQAGRQLDEQLLRAEKQAMLQNMKIVPHGWEKYVFTPGHEPRMDWENPPFAAEVIGPCRLTTRWFNANAEEVERPDRPGRYAAYTEGATASGQKIRRAATLFCRPLQWEPWEEDIQALPLLDPAGAVIAPEALKTNSAAAATATANFLIDAMNETENGAILLAFLHELKPDRKLTAVKWIESPWAQNLDFQLKVKRKLLGVEKQYPPLRPPRVEKNLDAPVLRAGTELDAGFKPGTAARLHEICRDWYTAGQKPFSTLVARRGVVIYHEAFGSAANGRDISINTPMWVASISKLLTGVTFAQLLDQKLVRLDDPIGRYLPDFPVTGPRTVTFRQCFTHTTGLRDHGSFGGLANPWLENSIANGLAALTPGKIHRYNGDGYNLAGKAMEVITGQSIPRLMQNHLFGPLQIDDAAGSDLGGGFVVNSTGLARVAQMLLNRGAYGHLRFFGEATFRQLLPGPLNVFYPGIDKEWGIGLTWMRDIDPRAGKNGIPAGQTILSSRTFGHGAASSAMFLVDPDRELIVIQTRNSAGKEYGRFRQKLLLEIAAAVTAAAKP